MHSWNHVKCFGLPRKLKQEGATIESFVTEELNDPEGLLEAHSDEIIAQMESKGAAAKMAHKKESDQTSSTNTMLGIIKRNYKMESVDDEDDRPSKKAKLLSDAEKKEVELYAIYKQKTLDELKDYMRYVLVTSQHGPNNTPCCLSWSVHVHVWRFLLISLAYTIFSIK